MVGLTRQEYTRKSRAPMLSVLVRLAQWVVPYRIYCAARDLRKNGGEAALLATGRTLAAKNSMLAGRHHGERCFILCNGPSVKQQDLLRLSGEVVISVSSGYHHPHYLKIQPRYHCVPQVSYAHLAQENVVRWFQEMHEKLGDAILFLSTTEEPLVRTENLFPGRQVHYVFLQGSMDERQGDAIPNLATDVPRVQSVSIMALMLAIYLGFSDIYLLGTDHDQFKTGDYKYFFEPTVLKGKDFTVASGGRVLTSRYQDFHEMASLWRQYRAIKEVARANNVRISNATAGGELDEFPRVRLEEVV